MISRPVFWDITRDYHSFLDISNLYESSFYNLARRDISDKWYKANCKRIVWSKFPQELYYKHVRAFDVISILTGANFLVTFQEWKHLVETHVYFADHVPCNIV